MKKDKAQRPNLMWVRDELAPINEEDRKRKLKLWKELMPKHEGKNFGKLYITGTSE
jgi:hypothetical protein